MAENKKGLGTLLSEALNIISENPVIIVPYLIPVLLVLLGAFIAFGTLVSTGAIQAGFELDPQYILDNALAFLGFVSVFGILAWLFTIAADAFAITITKDAILGKKVTLGEAWAEIGIEKLIILLVVDIILTILLIFGFFLICIGFVIFYVLFIFVMQGVIVSDQGIIDTFSNSYNIAKKNFFDILMLAIVLLVISVVVQFIPVIGGILNVLVGMYGVVAYTIMYLDRK